ncbi:MAG: glycoside hydrolase family 18 protein, partial [Planctomycetota bacterium]
MLLPALLLALAPQSAHGSAHAAQMDELARVPQAPTDDAREAAWLEATGASPRFERTGTPPERGLRDDAIVFGYLQSEAQVFHTRWHALTHVGSRFVGFDGNGDLTNLSAFTGRSSYLKAGGAAEAAGVKVVLVLANFSDGSSGQIAQVMTSPSRRANLAQQLADVMANDPYAHGVSLDLEFSWGSTVRDGITAFCAELRAALDAVDPALELSTYVGAIYQGSQWDFDAQTGITPHVDYVLYSMYDWATGQTPRAITNYGACIATGRMFEYCDAGLPPEKLVPTISAYSRRWNGVSEYGQPGSGASSGGFTDARYDTTLRPGVGPAAYRYERGAEAAWYTWNDGVQRVRTFDSLEALQLEVRQALAADDPSGRYDGRRLGGVGFWSLMWMAETSSVDMRTGQSVSRTRTYPHVYQLVQDAFARPGDPRRDLE